MAGKMRALRYYREEDELRVEDVDKPPQPQGNEVLIRVKATAFTSSELDWPETKERELPIPGHDVAGIIEVDPTIQPLTDERNPHLTTPPGRRLKRNRLPT